MCQSLFSITCADKRRYAQDTHYKGYLDLWSWNKRTQKVKSNCSSNYKACYGEMGGTGVVFLKALLVGCHWGERKTMKLMRMKERDRKHIFYTFLKQQTSLTQFEVLFMSVTVSRSYSNNTRMIILAKGFKNEPWLETLAQISPLRWRGRPHIKRRE